MAAATILVILVFSCAMFGSAIDYPCTNFGYPGCDFIDPEADDMPYCRTTGCLSNTGVSRCRGISDSSIESDINLYFVGEPSCQAIIARVLCACRYMECDINGPGGSPIKQICYSSMVAGLTGLACAPQSSVDFYLDLYLSSGIVTDKTPPECVEIPSFDDAYCWSVSAHSSSADPPPIFSSSSSSSSEFSSVPPPPSSVSDSASAAFLEYIFLVTMASIAAGL